MPAPSDDDDGALDDARHFTLLYGSQTGNAQDVAERIARQARRRRIATTVCSMDEYEISNLINETLVVCIISTTGNGDFPTSSLPFWRFLLRSDLPEDILSDVAFATFGLGDSSYVRYCYSARKLNKRLRGLGAQELIEAGEADDQHILGIEGTLRPWLDAFWEMIEDVMPPMPNGTSRIPDDEQLPPAIRVSLKPIASTSNGKSVNGSSSSALEEGWRWTRLKHNERITSADHWQDVRLIEFEDEAGSQIAYRPTDVVSLIPENDPHDVQRLLDRLGWTEVADREIMFQPSAKNVVVPGLLGVLAHPTLRLLLTTHLDFCSVPRPSFFERLIPFAPAEHMQREKLQEFCTPGEGADEMYEYAMRVRRTMLEVLEEFDAVQVPLEYLLDIFPPMRRREFSIASAPTRRQSSVELAVAIVSYKTRLKERRRGVCTSWLARLEQGERVPIHIAPSSMATSALRNHSAPTIYVGPGTGVAPIRSALLTRHDELQEQDKPMRAKDNLCFFGCRNRDRDWLFGGEWQSLAARGCIDAHLAASRDQDEKVYVQDLIVKQAQDVWGVIGRNLTDGIEQSKPLVYICGSAGKMPQAVRTAIVEVCQSAGAMTEEQANKHIDQMEIEGRWIEECWS